MKKCCHFSRPRQPWYLSAPKGERKLTVYLGLETHNTSNHLSPSFKKSESSDDASKAEFDADETLTSQATLATNFTQQAVDSHPQIQALPEVKLGLNAIRRILVDRDDRREKTHAADVQLLSPISGKDGFQMPPIQLAIAALQRLRGKSWPDFSIDQLR